MALLVFGTFLVFSKGEWISYLTTRGHPKLVILSIQWSPFPELLGLTAWAAHQRVLSATCGQQPRAVSFAFGVNWRDPNCDHLFDFLAPPRKVADGKTDTPRFPYTFPYCKGLSHSNAVATKLSCLRRETCGCVLFEGTLLFVWLFFTATLKEEHLLFVRGGRGVFPSKRETHVCN